MRKLFLIALGIMFAFSSLHAGKSSKFRVDELIILPHPGKALKLHAKELGVTKKEQMRIKKEVKAVYAPIFQNKIREAFKIEKSIRRQVAKGATKEQLKAKLDEVARLKREAMDSRIDALNTFRSILGDKKWKRVINYKPKGAN